MTMNNYETRIKCALQTLGIPSSYPKEFGFILQYEEQSLISIGNDIYNRPQKLSVGASAAWKTMRDQAEADNIYLYFVSAFRSVDKQIRIIQQRINEGLPISIILETSAAPGYSEHHTGRTIDVTTKNCEPLSKSFDKTEEFQWLQENAQKYGFELSYPKNNTRGIAYEPWHWAYVLA